MPRPWYPCYQMDWKIPVPISNNYLVFRFCLLHPLLAAIIQRSLLLAAIRPNWPPGQALHDTQLHWTALYSTALHFSALYCTALHCSAMQCTFLYWICTVTRGSFINIKWELQKYLFYLVVELAQGGLLPTELPRLVLSYEEISIVDKWSINIVDIKSEQNLSPILGFSWQCGGRSCPVWAVSASV